mmetsp:Transcript_22354/g.42133  ORF Transcript_22354/g.42133 Transcript_22354/m.42133 type:complete len:256 (-) Transcript_22354:85-852(-)
MAFSSMQVFGSNGLTAVPLVRIEEVYESADSDMSAPEQGSSSGRGAVEGCSDLLRSYQEVQLQDLQDMLLHKEDEIRELHHVISMKDKIIRSLGEEVGSAQAAADVISMKDQVIRMLQEELEKANACDPSPGAPDEQSPTTVFTALPIAEDTAYVPVPGDVVDERIAEFSNARRNLVMFTRLEDEGFYLFGRFLVQCVADDLVGVLVQEVDGDEVYSIEDFVNVFERSEHWQLEQHFLAAVRGGPGGTEPITRMS